MSRIRWLGIDLSTQGVHALLVESDGDLVGEGRRRFEGRPSGASAMTHDPSRDWTVGTVESIRDAIGETDPSQIEGVGVCGLFPSVALLDVSGMPFGEALLYGDVRARTDVFEAEQRLGVRLTGDEVSPRLLWLQRTRPEDLVRCAKLVGPTGFVVHLLTGRATIDPHSAYRWGGLVDGSRRKWDATAVERLGIAEEVLPDILDPLECAGRVSPSAASITGLAAGTPVIGGTTDSMATLIGHGAIRRGDLLVYYGSSWTVMHVTMDLLSVLRDPSQISDNVPWRLALYAVDAGRFVERLRREVFGARSFVDLDAEAALVPAGSRGVSIVPLPTSSFEGGRPQPSKAAIVGFGLESGRADLWRATLESLGYLVADAVPGGDGPHRWALAAGGGASSRTWRAVVSDAANLSQRFDPGASAALGAALLVAFAKGAVRSLDGFAENWLPEGSASLTAPDDTHQAEYSRAHAIWRIRREALAARTDLVPEA